MPKHQCRQPSQKTGYMAHLWQCQWHFTCMVVWMLHQRYYYPHHHRFLHDSYFELGRNLIHLDLKVKTCGVARDWP